MDEVDCDIVPAKGGLLDADQRVGLTLIGFETACFRAIREVLNRDGVLDASR